MKLIQSNSFPFWETIGRSFKYVFKNKALLLAVLPLAATLVIFQLLFKMPFLCAFHGTCPMGLGSTLAIIAAFFKGSAVNWPHLLTVVSIILGSAGIIINYCRTLVNKSAVDYISLKFWKRMSLYMVARICFDIVVFVLFAAFLIVLIKMLNLFHTPDIIYIVTVLFALLVSYILAAPIFLAFPAVSLDDYKFLLPKHLFQVTKGSFNAIFWGQFVIMAPYWLLFGALKELYAFVPQGSFIINFVFVTLLVLFSLLDACFKGAFFAHIYQFFNSKKYEDKVENKFSKN